MEFDLYYNPQKLIYNKVQGFHPNILGLSETHFANKVEPGNKTAQLKFSWLDPNVAGVTIPSSITMFQVCFTAANAEVQDTLKINIIEIIDGDEKIVRVLVNSPIIVIKKVACPPSISDIDGNTYNTVQIGTQCWTRENLRVTKYRDGTIIPLDESGGTAGNGTSQTWSSRTTGAITVYGHSATNLATYGYLYNWYAVVDSKGLCPSGWHVPSDSELTTLTNYLGGESVAGGKMKSTGTTIWNSPNTGATNESGFSALPGGYRDFDGIFLYIRNDAFFWSATEIGSNFAWLRYLNNYSGNVYRYNFNKQNGFSVRCLRD